MKCPKDNSLLTINSKENIVGHCCSQCMGIFLEGKGMLAFKYNFETGVLEKSFNNDSTIESVLDCSNCRSKMYVTNIDDVKLDICKHCQSVWFDNNEVRQIIDKHGQLFHKRKPSPFVNFIDDILTIPWLIGMAYCVYRFILDLIKGSVN